MLCICTQNSLFHQRQSEEWCRAGGSYPPGLDGFPPAWTQVEEGRADGKAAEGEHHFHQGHEDERNPQDNGGALVGKQTHRCFRAKIFVWKKQKKNYFKASRFVNICFSWGFLRRAVWGQRGIQT